MVHTIGSFELREIKVGGMRLGPLMGLPSLEKGAAAPRMVDI